MSPSPNICQACGRENLCGRAAGQPTCWCASQAISPAALSALPPAQTGQSCLCPECAGGVVPSPCIQICELDAATKVCRGCRRTLKEIEVWSSLTNDRKRAMLQRLAALPKPDAGSGP